MKAGFSQVFYSGIVPDRFTHGESDDMEFLLSKYIVMYRRSVGLQKIALVLQY